LCPSPQADFLPFKKKRRKVYFGSWFEVSVHGHQALGPVVLVEEFHDGEPMVEQK
jgi:hypothetical protein